MSLLNNEPSIMHRLYDLFRDARAEIESNERSTGKVEFTITASFNCHHGDMFVTAKCYHAGGIGESYESVEMPRLSLAIAEVLRRREIARAQAPICLPRAAISVEPG